MKQLLLLGVGLLGLCTFGLTSAKAGDDYGYNRRDSGDYGYRRPVYHERCDDGYGYRSQRRVVVVREYERPYYSDDCRPYYHHRHHVNLFLPLPPLPFCN